jgi:hypothetical protein
VRNVSIELEREPSSALPVGSANGTRKDDGTGLRVVAVPVTAPREGRAGCCLLEVAVLSGNSATAVEVAVPGMKDGTTGRWLLDVTVSSEDSVTESSTDAVALIVAPVTVEVVATVGDGDGARGGAVSAGLAASCSITPSEVSKGPDDDTALGESFVGAHASGGGSDDATTSDSEDACARDALDSLGYDEVEVGDRGGRDSGVLPFSDILLSVDLERARVAESLGPGMPSKDGCASKSGGGPCKLTSEADAYATASGPYGTPNLLTDSTDEISLSCSGVGPERGYTKSVRTAVCVSGAEIEPNERVDGEVSPAATLDTEREPVRDTARPSAEEAIVRIDPEPDGAARWPTWKPRG